MTTRPLVPIVDDIDTGGFFESARRHELAIRMCNGCDAVLHVPVAYCHRCGSWDTRWQAVAGRGHLHSWTVVAHQVHPAYPVPYTVLLVELEEHPEARLIGHLPGRPELLAGQPMEVWFDTIADGVVLPQWRPLTTEENE